MAMYAHRVHSKSAHAYIAILLPYHRQSLSNSRVIFFCNSSIIFFVIVVSSFLHTRARARNIQFSPPKSLTPSLSSRNPLIIRKEAPVPTYTLPTLCPHSAHIFHFPLPPPESLFAP